MTKLNLNLQQFTGSETFYCHWTKRFSYTEGIKYLADRANAYWLIDTIASFQFSPTIVRDPMLKEIQFWKLRVNADKSAILTCERDSDDIALTQEIEFTDFPKERITLYLSNSVLMLPTEY
jgi:hypothetical protein